MNTLINKYLQDNENKKVNILKNKLFKEKSFFSNTNNSIFISRVDKMDELTQPCPLD